MREKKGVKRYRRSRDWTVRRTWASTVEVYVLSSYGHYEDK